MIKNFKIVFLIICFFFIFENYTKSEEFFFESAEIKILENGNRLYSDLGVKVTTSDNTVITADKFDYNKITSLLKLRGNVVINDLDNQTKIRTNKIDYLKKLEKIISYDETIIFIKDEYTIKSENIIFLRNKKEIFSEAATNITDNYNNNFTSENFLFSIPDEILKSKNVTFKDHIGNKTTFENFFGDLKNKQVYGKNAKYFFNKGSFGNKKNEPRLYGNILESNSNKTEVSKGIFTTCKRRDGCPPWTIKANKITHDKNKKIITYQNAWLQVYDKPIFYFPKFFHPDPTVKRQSGFLIPKFTESSNAGISLQMPYFKVLADNKDLTFSPRIFADQKLILQNEYRRVEKNYNHIMDVGIFTSVFTNDQQTSKSHFFSNTKLNLQNSFFEENDLEINLEQVTNDTYLKKYKINSPLIKNETLMHTFVEYNGYNDDSLLNISFETYEDLTKNDHDRYEIIYPNLKYSKDLEKNFNLNGGLNFSSSIYQKQYETNRYEQSLINDLTYSSPSMFGESGIVKNYKLQIKNPNTRHKTGSNKESHSKNQLLSNLMYNLSYPLKKEGKIYDNLLKPNISFRYSPNKTKNIALENRRLDTTNVNSFNRISIGDGIEGGESLTMGLEYIKKDKNQNEKLSIDLAQVIRSESNPDLPTSSTLNNKYSDIIGRVKFNLINNLNFEYNFMMDNNFDRTNYNSVLADISVNNFVTSFEYLEESALVGNKGFISNNTSYSFDENNSLTFSTRRNREIDLTEFYNLVYQYENDCLKAALEYNKTFYSDGDIEPEEQLFFSLTIVPFTKINTTNLK
tara:strand:- start:121 stop:2520 length:2400 start_codon:yes stop_codon:yes gene_type:complete